MARQTQETKQLASIEKIKVKSANTDKNNKLVEVIAEDGREFLVFKNHEHAKSYAVKMYVQTEDDPKFLKKLRMLGKSVTQYGNEEIDRSGVQSILSYDQHHKVELKNNAVAYRTL